MKTLRPATKTLSACMALYLAVSACCLPAVADPLANLAPKDIQDLKELLQACDATVKAGEADLQAQKKVNEVTTQAISVRDEQIKDLQKSQDSLLKSPILWFGVGMLATALTVHLVK